MKTVANWFTVAFALLVVNLMILGKERTIADGQTVLLKLAPVDPRSLMQGDYMILRYEAARKARHQVAGESGNLILQLNTNNVGSFIRLDEGEPLAKNEIRLKYRFRDGVRLGAESFFFEEGTADEFSEAEYGELKVAENGASVLISLRDKNLIPIR